MIRLQSLTVQGFKNLNIKNLQFPEEGNILIIGKNESGKSSLFEAIYYALTGSLLVKDSQNRTNIDAVAFNKNAATVELKFQKENSQCKIIRKIIRSRTVKETLDFWKNIDNPQEVHQQATKKSERDRITREIADFIGFDKEILLNSCFVEQKKIDSLLVKKERERKATIEKLINMDKFKELLDVYKKEITDLKKLNDYFENCFKIETTRNKQKCLKENLKQISEIIDRVEHFISELEKMDELLKKLNDLESNNKDLQENIKKLEQELNELNNKKKKLEEINIHKENSKKLDDSVKQLEQKKQNLEKIHVTTIEEISRLKKIIDDYRNNQEKIVKLKQKYVQIEKKLQSMEIQKKYITKLQEIELDLKDILKGDEYSKKEQQNLVDQLKSQIIELLEEIDEDLTFLIQVPKELVEGKSKSEMLEIKKKKLKESIRQFEKYEKINQNLKTIKINLEKHNTELKQLRSTHELITTSKQEYTELSKQIQKIKLEQKKNQEKQEILEIEKKKLKKQQELKIQYEEQKRKDQEKFQRIEQINTEISQLKNQLTLSEIERNLLIKSPNDVPLEIYQENSELTQYLKKHNLFYYKEEKKIDNIIKNLEEIPPFKSRLGDKMKVVLGGSSITFLILAITMGIFVHKAFYFLFLVSLGIGVLLILDLKQAPILLVKNPLHREYLKKINSYVNNSSFLHDSVAISNALFLEDNSSEIISLLTKEKEILQSKYDRGYINQYENEIRTASEVNYCDLEQQREYLFKLKEETEKNIAIIEKLTIERNKLLHDQKSKTKDQEFNENIIELDLQTLNDDLSKVEQDIVKIHTQLTNFTNSLDEKVSRQKQLEFELKKYDIQKIETEIKNCNKILDDLSHSQEMVSAELKKMDIDIQNFNLEKLKEDLERTQTKITTLDNNLKNKLHKFQVICDKYNIDFDLEDTALISWDQSKVKKFCEIHNNISKLCDPVREINQVSKSEFPKIIIEFLEKITNFQVKPVLKRKIQENYSLLLNVYEKIDEISENKNKKNAKIVELKSKIKPEYHDYVNFSKIYEDLKKRIAEIGRDITNITNQIEQTNLIEIEKEIKKANIQNNEHEEEINELTKKIKEKKDELTKKLQVIPPEYKETNIKNSIEGLQQFILQKSNEKAKKNSALENQTKLLFKDIKKWMEKNNISLSQNLEYPELKEEIIKKTSVFRTNSLKLLDNFEKQAIHMLLSWDEELEVNSESSLKEKIIRIRRKLQNKEGAFENSIRNWENQCKIHERDKNLKKKIKDLQKYENPKKNFDYVNDLFKIYECAKEILSDGTTQVSQKVLPKINENLCRILPILTAGRYKDGLIEKNYQVKLFDSKRADYVDKVLFSGGTNDQIALAVRLAFAISLMRDDTNKESFIFLDEPLGFFDDERRNALIDFLTHGIIAKKFAQRFVVSNYLMIKPYFDYIIEIDNGKIQKNYQTGSYESKQLEIEQTYQRTDQSEIIAFTPLKSEEEDGYIEGIVQIQNISPYEISKFKIKIIDTVNLQIKPIECHEIIAPNENYEISLEFHSALLTKGIINLQIKITYRSESGNNDFVQKIQFNPSLLIK
ncbi:AAA family ATPase [Candidatus Harpocratesius sp.]